MVRELRYDEALALYHRALLQDASNYGFRYDIGQLYERLGLYPDALYSYLRLVNEIFPVRVTPGSDPRRSHKPIWWPEAARDPFVIRYRYVVALGQAGLLARDLGSSDWDRLDSWIDVPYAQDSDTAQLENRPWRATELKEIQRLLSAELDSLYPSLANEGSAEQGKTLIDKIDAGNEDATLPRYRHKTLPWVKRKNIHIERRKRASVFGVERYLLSCALREANSLVEDFTAINRRRFWEWPSRATAPSLTLASVRSTVVSINYRVSRLNHISGSAAYTARWPIPLDEIRKDLQAVKYDPKTSTSWLEHYNVACLYALALLDDEKELAAHKEYAIEAVAALERALKCGEDVDFVRAKRYWLQAGDPDLVGLRKYECFRAFAGRVYGRPLPTAADISKYELYLYLRAVVESGARRLEEEWRMRVAQIGKQVSYSELEGWWHQEEQAWELAIRLGRFIVNGRLADPWLLSYAIGSRRLARRLILKRIRT